MYKYLLLFFLTGCASTIIQRPVINPPKPGVIECFDGHSCSDARNKMAELCGEYNPEIYHTDLLHHLNDKVYVLYFYCIKR